MVRDKPRVSDFRGFVPSHYITEVSSILLIQEKIKRLKILSNLSQIVYMMEEEFQLSQPNSSLTPKPACLATPPLD